MKIIHCADIHLGSKINSRFPKEVGETLKEETRQSFRRMVEYATNNDIKLILLSGDVFDSDKPYKKDKDFFYKIVKNNPDIDFLYLRGNHDSDEAYHDDTIKNLKIFNDEWRKYSYGNIDIYGIEINDKNALSFYSSFTCAKEKTNIVMLHGQVSDTTGIDKIQVSKLRNKDIDYLALGHIHSFEDKRIDERGVYVYSGCLEGRGFDEIGPKGFVEITIDNNIEYKFQHFSMRDFLQENVNISGTTDSYNAYQKIKSVLKCDKKNIVLVNLIGDIDFDNTDLNKEIEEYLKDFYFYVYVKDNTKSKIDYSKYFGQVSLYSEFINQVNSNTNYTDEEKQKIIAMGIKALNGRDF